MARAAEERQPIEAAAGRGGKSSAAFRTISEVAEELDVAQHVLRFWESKFPQVRPLKRGGGRRYYRPEDIELLRDIRTLLYEEGYTIKGAQKLLRQRRARPVAEKARHADSAAPDPAPAAPAPEAGPAAAGPPALDDARRARLVRLAGELRQLRDELREAAPPSSPPADKA